VNKLSMDGFEEFRPGTREQLAMLSVNSNGHIRLTRKALDDLGNPRRVQTLFNPKTKQIMLRAAEPDDKGAYTVSKEQIIPAHGFTRQYPISQGRYAVKIKDGVLVTTKLIRPTEPKAS
jgi:hypothetical protein